MLEYTLLQIEMNLNCVLLSSKNQRQCLVNMGEDALKLSSLCCCIEAGATEAALTQLLYFHPNLSECSSEPLR